ncbi:glutamine--tRNA ligase [Chlorella sorokiniana]|uniref:glutamine--tRNA ligase n=1 Tax=Chlorella sorokiniana TaxID=3076 RepID=A0A2P6TQX8_CHLSO|nr:glutamine--tRNA ligase [Chlorella sorokiniana]|eukprot:PRW56443.1 glutamine--tRNA ligase [Chlorella sorokiniana]
MASREELEAEALKLFTGIGLVEKTAQEALVKPKFRQALVELIKEAGAADGCPKSQGALLYTTASKYPANALAHRGELLAYITSDRIRSNAQLDGALDYLGKVGSEPIDVAAFEQAAGVGVEVGPEQIKEAVAACIKENEAKLKEERYHCNLNILLGKMRGSGGAIKWADVGALKAELEAQVAALLGPKTEADLVKPEKKKKPVKAAAPAENGAAAAAPAKKASEGEEAWRTADPWAFLPKPQQNNMVHTTVHFSDERGQMNIANSPERLAKHLGETGGKVVTRFPPEPNGYLHIGHAKAMFVDFGMARQYDGVCLLRFDDTNPEAEKQEYIDHIQEIVSWLGWQPWKVTYSSDYFDQLYAFALQLIRGGHAYVCHQTGDEIKDYRERREPSPWRDRPIEESLKLFEDMRRGLVDEGKATLRMKMDHKNENFNMFDLIAYRIKFVEHPHAGDKWCVYPSYDFTHCLVDALENVTHSMCTLEFESRRASYYWLLEVLGTYKPLVWEYSRLNITHNVMSKRKLNRLVTDKYVDGWDDPRLLTLAGLRRRGVTPTAVNNFCREIGVTRSEGEVHLHKLDHHIRADLDATSRRALGVLRPLRVVITNLPDSHFEEVEAKYFPGRGEEGYKVPFTKVVYIEETDFREADSKDYYGLAPGKSVMLRYAYPVTCTGFSKDASGRVTEVQATYDPDFASKKPPKGVLNWVGQPAPGKEPPTFEARLYDVLFKGQNPAALDDWLGDLNPESLVAVKGAYATPELAQAKPGERFQLERLGYFCVDTESTPRAMVLNRTCTLKESFPKQTAAKGGRK